MQVILDSPFARPGSAPIWGGKKGEFRDWTNDIDADFVKPDGQNSVISFVISKWLLPELSFSDRWSRRTKTLGTRLCYCGPKRGSQP